MNAIDDLPVIETRQLRRTYAPRRKLFSAAGGPVEALRGIDLEVRKGELFGLLGPNGSGKTTLIKILATLLLPTSGTAVVLGQDVSADPTRIRSRIGLVLGGERGLYNRVSAWENLRYFAELYDIPRHQVRARIETVLREFGLGDVASRPVEEFSRGMKQRLHLARGLLHEPELLFLDEPTIGLDPQVARELREKIRELAGTGVTILLTTHYMFEAEDLCSRVGILSGGRLLVSDTVPMLRRLIGGESTVECDGYGFDSNELEAVRRILGVRRVSTDSVGPRQRLTLRVDGSVFDERGVRAILRSHPELEVRERRTTLEDVYLDVVEGGQ